MCRRTAGKPGRTRTTPPRSSTTSRRPTTFPTGCAAPSRTTPVCVGRAAGPGASTGRSGTTWRVSRAISRRGLTTPTSPTAATTQAFWAGSDDGLVHVTRNGGKTWTDVTPRDVAPFTRVSIIEASHFAPGTAYLAANRYQLDDLAPYIYRTIDYGRSWIKIVKGIPATEFVRVVREDPTRRGLLYAGTARGVWVSFDDGASWQSNDTHTPRSVPA